MWLFRAKESILAKKLLTLALTVFWVGVGVGWYYGSGFPCVDLVQRAVFSSLEKPFQPSIQGVPFEKSPPTSKPLLLYRMTIVTFMP